MTNIYVYSTAAYSTEKQTGLSSEEAVIAYWNQDTRQVIYIRCTERQAGQLKFISISIANQHVQAPTN